MRKFIVSAVFALLFPLLLQGKTVPSYEEIKELETTYIIRFHDKEPQHPENVSVKLGPNTNYKGQFLAFAKAGSSSLSLTFETPQDFSSEKKHVELRLSHLAAMLAGNFCHAKIQISVNEKVFIPCFDPSDGKISNDTFDITNWVKEGTNTLHMKLLEGPSQYWVHSINLTFF